MSERRWLFSWLPFRWASFWCLLGLHNPCRTVDYDDNYRIVYRCFWCEKKLALPSGEKQPHKEQAMSAPLNEWWPEDGAIIVRKSAHPTHPFYLQQSLKAPEIGWYHVHALINEQFATREEAEARAAELALPSGEKKPQ